jgi:serine protease Do
MKRNRFTLLIIILLTNPLIFSQEKETEWKHTVRALQQDFRDISQKVLPVVVEVNVTDRVTQNIPLESPWRFFFSTPEKKENDLPLTREYTRSGLGSGVIIKQEGNRIFVITNYHVAGRADEISITLYDGRQFVAELCGTDREGDLALLSFIGEGDFPIAELGDSNSLTVGDWVLAVGNPYGYESTVTQGIISAAHRSIPMNEQKYGDYIQTDASINSGNSGGALVNMKGEIIGINTWIATRTGANIGLGFAIPINKIKDKVDYLIGQNHNEKGWLGVDLHRATESLKSQMGLEEWEGVFVYNIYSDSPARTEGIQPGDLIIALNGEAIQEQGDFLEQLSQYHGGDRIKITFIRAGRELTKTITLAPYNQATIDMRSNSLWPGFSATELTDEMRKQMGINGYGNEMIIDKVIENSLAATLGLRQGDIIKSLNGEKPENIKEFYNLLDNREMINIRIERRGYDFQYLLKL